VNDTASALALAILAATAVPNNLAGMMPSLMTIEEFTAKDNARKALRRGEMLGSSISLAEGIAASVIAHSWLPFLATAIVLAVYLVAYEHSIRNPSPDAQPISDQ
jgi:hypothetical protein